MKKFIFGFLLAVILLGTGAYFFFQDRFLFRAPLLVLGNAKITFLYGDVVYKKSKDKAWEKANVGLALKKGYEVKTGALAKVDIAFNKDTVIRIGEKTEFVIEDSNIREISLNLKEGSFYGKFMKMFQEQNFIIKTPSSLVGIRGTELGFETGKDEQNKVFTNIYAISGIIEVYNPKYPDKKILLSYNSKCVIKEDSAPENPMSLKEDETSRIRQILNSMHSEEVFLITNKILFKFASAEIMNESTEELKNITEMIKKSKAKIRIEGHTDNIGEAAANQILSEKRAQAVKDYLVKNGIAERRLSILGYGASKPIADNKEEKGRDQNRRVEFIIKD